jgi:murein DD-endopeptidase MepM/ murein hydrolase activator NlpD
MAHSHDRIRPITTGLLIAGCLIGVLSSSALAQTTTSKPTTTVKKVVPVAASNTVPSNTRNPVDAGDANDGVDREENGTFTAVAGWACPVPGSTFRNDWGNPRSGGRTHQGTDMFAAMGAPVLAPVSGTVRQHTGGLGGLAFYLDGVDGAEYYGAHLSSLEKTGPVLAGQEIARVGDSGNAKGGAPHLHFEIHPSKKTRTNPYPTLSTNCATVASAK